MPALRELAHLRGVHLTGVDHLSSLEDQSRLVYEAAREHAAAQNFERFALKGRPGRRGGMVMARITSILFPRATRDELRALNGLVNQVLRQTGAAVCLRRPTDGDDRPPTWFIADEMPADLTLVAIAIARRGSGAAAGAPNGSGFSEPAYLRQNERKLTAHEAGEDLPPNEVTVRSTETEQTEQLTGIEARNDAFEARRRQIVEDHARLKQAVLEQVLTSPVPLTCADVETFLRRDDASFDLTRSAVTHTLRELADEAQLARRRETRDERLVRGGGHLPKAGPAYLYAGPPGPVPARTQLPDGVDPVRPAKAIHDEVAARRTQLETQVLEVLRKQYPKQEKNRPRSTGRIAALIPGATAESVKRALLTLERQGLVYESSNGNWYDVSRRRGPKRTTREPQQPEAALHAAEEAAPVPALVAPHDAFAQLNKAMTTLGNAARELVLQTSAKVPVLSVRVAELERENAELREKLDSLRRALA